MLFSDVVKAEISERGITLQRLADDIGCTKSYLSKLLRGKDEKRWNEDAMLKTCAVLGLEITYTRKAE